MINEHRPYYIKRLHMAVQSFYTRHFIAPQLTHLGQGHAILKPWHLLIYGQPISIGDFAHIICTPNAQVQLTVLGKGRIEIGKHALITPGVRMSSASLIKIGDDCMFAYNAYLTDADWHGIYHREKAIGATAPIVLGNNVWVGDSAIICKGVTIGDNSIIGAGAVVAKDIPANSIAVGNPARVVKELDPEIPITTRAELFRNPEQLQRELERIDRNLLKNNTMLGWLRSKLLPRPGD